MDEPNLFSTLARAAISRRQLLQGGAAAVSMSMLGRLLAGCGDNLTEVPLAPEASGRDALQPLALGFTAVAKSLVDAISLPEGYGNHVVHALGDPLASSVPAWRGDGSESAESYQARFGDAHDGMQFFGLERAQFAPGNSNAGLLCVNHEYVPEPYALHPSGRSAWPRLASEVDKEIAACGLSICEVRRNRQGRFEVQLDSHFNRRITSASPHVYAGPAAGSPWMVTKHDAEGRRGQGTNNNCASGATPWGTYLTCEENVQDVFGRAAGDDDPAYTARDPFDAALWLGGWHH